MCMKVDCDECGKPTWKGCGRHIEQALKEIPLDERCKCSNDSCETKTDSAEVHEEKKLEESSTEEPNMENQEESRD